MKSARLTLVFAAALLAACQATPPPPVAQLPAAGGPARGIDLPTDASDVIGQLRGFPIKFVARYYRDPSSRWPALTPTEAQRLSAAGLNIVSVWEWHSNSPSYFTYANGYNDALSASRQAKTVGQPPGSAIYFAVDFNARGSQLWQVDQYFRGVVAGLAAAGGGRPEYKVGVYGSGAVCAAVRGARLAQYAWLSGSSAWEGTAGYSSWNIRQAAAGARFANLSFDHDANEARDDYGGFQIGRYAQAVTPASAAITAAAVAPAAAAAVVNDAVSAAVPRAAAVPPPPPPPPPVAVASAPPPPPAAPMKTAALTPPGAAPAPAESAPPPPRRIAAAPVPPPKPDTGFAAAVERAAAAMGPSRAYAAELRPTREGPRRTIPAMKAASSREPAAPHAAKALAGSKRTVYAVATNKPAAAGSPRNLGGGSHGEFHERGHRVSAPRRPQDHGAHLQARRSRAVPVLH